MMSQELKHMYLIFNFLILMHSFGCKSTRKIYVVQPGIEFKIDSIKIYSNRLWSHTDQEFCYYDSLKAYALRNDQICQTNQFPLLLDSIGEVLANIEDFVAIYKDSALKFALESRVKGENPCGELPIFISELYEVYLNNGRIIRIGADVLIPTGYLAILVENKILRDKNQKSNLEKLLSRYAFRAGVKYYGRSGG